MIVVSDTSVVTALIQIGRIGLLAEIFGRVVILGAVADELAVSHVTLPAWIRTICVRDDQVVEDLLSELDAGESEAIALALELGADFLLIDEKRGRARRPARRIDNHRDSRCGKCGEAQRPAERRGDRYPGPEGKGVVLDFG